MEKGVFEVKDHAERWSKREGANQRNVTSRARTEKITYIIRMRIRRRFYTARSPLAEGAKLQTPLAAFFRRARGGARSPSSARACLREV